MKVFKKNVFHMSQVFSVSTYHSMVKTCHFDLSFGCMLRNTTKASTSDKMIFFFCLFLVLYFSKLYDCLTVPLMSKSCNNWVTHSILFSKSECWYDWDSKIWLIGWIKTFSKCNWYHGGSWSVSSHPYSIRRKFCTILITHNIIIDFTSCTNPHLKFIFH